MVDGRKWLSVVSDGAVLPGRSFNRSPDLHPDHCWSGYFNNTLCFIPRKYQGSEDLVYLNRTVRVGPLSASVIIPTVFRTIQYRSTEFRTKDKESVRDSQNRDKQREFKMRSTSGLFGGTEIARLSPPEMSTRRVLSVTRTRDILETLRI